MSRYDRKRLFYKAQRFVNRNKKRAAIAGVYSNLNIEQVMGLISHNHKCYRCGTIMYDIQEKTIDHKKALSLGGTNTIDNLAICCDRCNNDKGRTEYIELYKIKVAA